MLRVLHDNSAIFHLQPMVSTCALQSSVSLNTHRKPLGQANPIDRWTDRWQQGCTFS